MSLAALSGFTQGFAGGLDRKKQEKARAEENARRDRYIDAIGSMGAMPPDLYGGASTGAMQGSAGGDSMTPFIPPQAGNSGYGSAAPGAGGSTGATIVDLLRKHEGAGDPSTLFGHSQRGGKFDGIDVSKMTIGQLREFSRPDGEYGQWVKSKVGRVATPMGFGQIVGTTMRNTAEAMGLPDDTVFNEQTQASMVNHLARQRLQSAKSPAAKRAAMRAEWEGFKHVPDSQLDAAIANFEQNGGVIAPRPMGASPV